MQLNWFLIVSGLLVIAVSTLFERNDHTTWRAPHTRRSVFLSVLGILLLLAGLNWHLFRR